MEDVDEPHQQSFSVVDPVTTVTSSYHTSDAVPNTVYYRDQVDDKGLPRPSLDALHDLEQHTVKRSSVSLYLYVYI